MNKKLVVFDLDGTLLDTIGDLANAVNYGLEKMNFPTHPLGSYKVFIGNGITKLLQRALPQELKDDMSVVEKLRMFFLEYYDENMTNSSIIYGGINGVLDFCVENKIAIAVASNKYHKATLKIMNELFADYEFVSVLGQREGFPTKPNPQILNEIIDNFNIDKSKVLFVGDSQVDIETAQNANVDVCAVTWGYGNLSLMKELKPNFIANHPIEIINCLRE